jgi:phosphoribosylanthranilate isomerase
MSVVLTSITGADDQVDPKTLKAISEFWPWTEWAILYFPEREGTARNPTKVWRDRFLDVCGRGRCAAHLCGEEAFRLVLAEDPATIDELRQYDRVQLNINARHRIFTDDEVLQVYRKMEELKIPYILQYHEGSKDLIQTYLLECPGRAQVLFDTSRGRGVSPESWPEPLSYVDCGYAGGINTDNIRNVIHAVNSVSGNQKVWIDLESGARTGNVFDLNKVLQILYTAYDLS